MPELPKYAPFKNLYPKNLFMNKYYLCPHCSEKTGYESGIKKVVCDICNNLFEKVDHFTDKTMNLLKDFEFSTLTVGVRLPKEEVCREEEILKEIVPDHVKPAKIDFGEIIGFKVTEKLNKTFAKDDPDITLLIDPKKDVITLQIKPIYIYGIYKKFKRGIPQTRWPCSRCRGLGCKSCNFTGQQYPETVEGLVASEFLKVTKGEDSKFHGAGREDIDALNIGGREFVLEIRNPKLRTINLDNLEKASNNANKGKVEISGLRLSNKTEIIALKNKKSDKTYRALTELNTVITKKDLEKLEQLNNTVINQRTPIRVSHRRGDIIRKRRVLEIKYNLIDKKTIELFIKGEAGLYIKELVSGDDGRTKPSVSEILDVEAVVKELDVVDIDS